MADVHPFGSRVTPPLSPSLPLASQGVLCRVDQVPHTVGNIVSCIVTFFSKVIDGARGGPGDYIPRLMPFLPLFPCVPCSRTKPRDQVTSPNQRKQENDGRKGTSLLHPPVGRT